MDKAARVVEEDGAAERYNPNKLPKDQAHYSLPGKRVGQHASQAHFTDQPHLEAPPSQPHGMDDYSHNKHLRMAEAIADCEALLCRGMGMGAYESLKVRGIRPVVTDIESIDDAMLAYDAGQINEESAPGLFRWYD